MKKLIIILTIALSSLFVFNLTNANAVYNPLQPCSSAAIAAGTCTNPCPQGSTQPVCVDAANQSQSDTNPVVSIITKATKIVSIIIGFASVALIVVSGIGLISSGGNPEAVKSARSRIIGAAIGLVVAALAYTLADFVLTKL